MKKIALTLLIASFSTSFATYQVVYPNQIVNFKSDIVKETFTPTDPLISDWSDVGAPYDCSNYGPDPSGYSYGVKFTQISNNCKINQERTIQNRQISSISQAVSTVGEPIVEQQVVENQTSSRDGTGTRYNYIINIGSYTAWGTQSFGYFSPSYLSMYGANVNVWSNGYMDTTSFRGSTIDHLVEQNGNITLRLVPAISGALPVISINGKTCTLVGPSAYSSYDANCPVNLINNIGQNLYIDLR